MKLNLYLLSIFIIVVSCGVPTGDGESVDGVPEDGHRIFVTSTTYTGNLGGISGANSKCVSAASAAGLTLNYVAIVSISGNNAKNRITSDATIYTVENGVSALVVEGLSDLWNTDSNALYASVSYDEHGTYVGDSVWTGTQATGEYGLSNSCSSWTSDSNGSNGTSGESSATDGNWLGFKLDFCDIEKSIYCISQ